jgi:hypothetical protein
MHKTTKIHLQKTKPFKWLAFIVIAGSIQACTQSDEKTTGKTTTGKTTVESPTQAVTGQSAPKKSIALPSDFPTDAPVFPNARLVDTTFITSEKSYALSYSLDQSKGTTQQVIDFYIAELTKQGWKIPEAPILNKATGNFIVYAKKGSKEFRVMTYPLPDQNNDVSINLNLAGYSK